MNLFVTLTQLAITINSCNALFKGFNVAARLPSGMCRSQDDWESAFQRLSSFSDHTTSARLFASSYCDTLANAVPAAIKTNTSLLVGIWTEDNAYFDAEKAALLQAIDKYGSDWFHAASVGSEDLHRKGITAQLLADRIHDIRNSLIKVGVRKPVGHVDTWKEWIDPANQLVVDAVDFLGNDLLPQWQLIGVETGFVGNTYWRGIHGREDMTHGSDIWMTTTGQLNIGNVQGNGLTNVQTPQTY